MEYTKIGRIRPVYRGAWSPDTAYTVLDTVIAADGRASYMAKKDVPAGTALDNDEYWGVVLDASGVIQAAEQAVGEVRAEASRKANPLEASAAGNPVQIYPDAGSILKPVSVMNPVQAGSGDPHPAGGGKNLIPYPYVHTTKTDNGITFTDNGDGSITVNGTCGAGNTSNASFVLTKALDLSSNDVYSIGAAGKVIGNYMVSAQGSNVAGVHLIYNGASSKALSIRVMNGTTVNNLTVYPQVELGSAVTAWHPYENIRPITGRTGAELARCGKNLLNNAEKTWTSHGIAFSLNADGSVSYTGTGDGSDAYYYGMGAMSYANSKKFAKGTYSVSVNNSAIVAMVRRVYEDESWEPVGYFNSDSFTLAEDAYLWLCFYINKPTAGTSYTGAFYPQLEYGSTATPFEPYHGGTFSLDFGQTVYGGTLDWNSGVLTVDKGYMSFTGDEYWIMTTTSESDKYRARLANITNMEPNTNTANKKDIMCSHYAAVSPNANYQCWAGICIETINTITIYDARYNTNDVSLWKAYLKEQATAGTPLQIAYKLATPVTIQLTPQQILALDGVNTLQCDCDSMTVTYNKSLIKAFEEALARIAALEAAATTT